MPVLKEIVLCYVLLLVTFSATVKVSTAFTISYSSIRAASSSIQEIHPFQLKSLSLKRSGHRGCHKTWLSQHSSSDNEDYVPHNISPLNQKKNANPSSRRSAVGQIIATGAVLTLSTLTQAQPSSAATSPPRLVTSKSSSNALSTESKFECLLDLPPIPTDHIRIFLCRHGQTENNRLGKVQGARVDPPLNDKGQRQAARLGKALRVLKDDMMMNYRNSGGDLGNGYYFPNVVMHSKLQRAKETADIISVMIGKNDIANANNDEENVNYVAESNINGAKQQKLGLDVQSLSSIGEVDFGPVDGKSVKEAKGEMMATYAQWALGRIDTYNGDDGESARSVFTRAASALNTLLEIATKESTSGKVARSVAVVSHSTYLRMLLSLVSNDVSLLDAATFDQKNCCINVVDVSTIEKREINCNSHVFGGKMISMAPSDFNLVIPKTQVVRMNEIRHLDGL